MADLENIRQSIELTINGEQPFLLLEGDCRKLLDYFPDDSIDCIITSPPYWNMRVYKVEQKYLASIIGNEETPENYVSQLTRVSGQLKRILKPTGSFWLNLGDKYHNKNLLGLPWRVALSLQAQGWILRNDVIWDRMKGTQSAKDRLRASYEHIFHFVKNRKYYYDDESIRIKPNKTPTMDNGRIVSATGVSGIKYREQILTSQSLTAQEKQNALAALDDMLNRMKRGDVVDFRMTIRGQQRTLHSDSNKVSGRAKELEERGYFFLVSDSKGPIPKDIWRIVPEDAWRKDTHYAVFPVELLKIPIKASVPKKGIILDPFMGIGSTIVAAIQFGRRGIGIDISRKYVEIAQARVDEVQS